MKRKRITELFPFLLPLRQKQKKICFYLNMKIDKNKYSNEVSIERLPFKLYKTNSKIINYNSGYDIKYQHNKIHN
ncbi:MAG: vancomycin resistance protein, partial [Peptostreptococcaceae bacterium]